MYGSPVARRVSTSFWNSERASTVPRTLPSLGLRQRERFARAHRFHEGVGDEHAVVQVQCLAVEVARRFADLEELLDLGMRDIEVARRRAAPERSLRNRQSERVHHPHEGNDAAGLAVEADRLADPAHAAPIGADAAPAARQPHVLVPGGDDALEAVGHRIEVARNRKSAPRTPVREHRRRRHEPQIGDVVVKPLGMLRIIGIGVRHAGEQVLVRFAGQQVAIGQRLLAEIGEIGVTRGIGDDGEPACIDGLGIAGSCSGRSFGARLPRLHLIGRPKSGNLCVD